MENMQVMHGIAPSVFKKGMRFVWTIYSKQNFVNV